MREKKEKKKKTFKALSLCSLAVFLIHLNFLSQLTLRRMGISLGLNYAANFTILMLCVLFILNSISVSLSIPYFGNVPIIYSTDVTVRASFNLCYSASLVSYCVLGSVLFHKGENSNGGKKLEKKSGCGRVEELCNKLKICLRTE